MPVKLSVWFIIVGISSYVGPAANTPFHTFDLFSTSLNWFIYSYRLPGSVSMNGSTPVACTNTFLALVRSTLPTLPTKKDAALCAAGIAWFKIAGLFKISNPVDDATDWNTFFPDIPKSPAGENALPPSSFSTWSKNLVGEDFKSVSCASEKLDITGPNLFLNALLDVVA